VALSTLVVARAVSLVDILPVSRQVHPSFNNLISEEPPTFTLDMAPRALSSLSAVRKQNLLVELYVSQ